jgi:hypothetical protein
MCEWVIEEEAKEEMRGKCDEKREMRDERQSREIFVARGVAPGE